MSNQLLTSGADTEHLPGGGGELKDLVCLLNPSMHIHMEKTSLGNAGFRIVY